MIHLPCTCRDRTAVCFPANSSHMCCVELVLDRLLCTHFGSYEFLRRGFTLFINPMTLPRWWAPLLAKQLSVVATARVVWLCACVRYWPGHGLLLWCTLLYVCTIFNAIELSTLYYSPVTVFHDSSKQIQQCRCIGKIFVCWHLVIAITSLER